jgi:tetratricopeptide (TPR) repeat protein
MVRARTVLLPAVAVLILSSAPEAQESAPSAEQQVVAKYDHPLMVDGRKPEDEHVFRIYSLVRVDGEMLRVKHENLEGWLPVGQALRIDEAIDFYTQELLKNPSNVKAWKCRGRIWVEKREYGTAISDFGTAIQLNPKYAAAYFDRGIARGHHGDCDGAVADLTEVIRLEPSDAHAYHMRAHVWLVAKQFEKAIVDFTGAMRLDSKYADAYYGRGMAWHRLHHYEKAVTDYTEAIRLEPTFAKAHDALAWLRATCPDGHYRDGRRAVEDATRACELNGWKAGHSMRTLAAAYAEAGDFEKAIQWHEKGREPWPSGKTWTEWTERNRLYKEKKPYRQKS